MSEASQCCISRLLHPPPYPPHLGFPQILTYFLSYCSCSLQRCLLAPGAAAGFCLVSSTLGIWTGALVSMRVQISTFGRIARSHQALTTLSKLGCCSTVCIDPSIPLYPVISAHDLVYKSYSHYREEDILWSTFLNVVFTLHWMHFKKIETKDFVSNLHTCHLHFI